MKKKRKIKNKISVSKMPQEIAVKQLPYTIIKMLNGANVTFNYHGKQDAVCLTFDNKTEILHKEDFLYAKQVCEWIYSSWIQANNIETSYQTIKNTLSIHKLATDKIAEIYSKKFDHKIKVLFIKGDNAGCGYWRMMLPANFLSDDYAVDVSNIEVIYEYLLCYDIIVIQRTLSWESLYVIDKLQKAGKKIIYDIDDNIFEIPPHNPSSKKFGMDELTAAASIMQIVDNITVTTERLKDKLVKWIGEGIKNKIVVIPNAIDYDEFPVKSVYRLKREDFRIVWSGSATHEIDFLQCLSGLDKFVKKHANDNIKIFFFGFCPQCVIEAMKQPYWKNKVEYMKFNDVETYFSIIKELEADIALIPLALNDFNVAKSPIKWIEYSLASVPSVISKVPPYIDYIKDNEAIFCQTQQEWCDALESRYENYADNNWNTMVSDSRNNIDVNFNIKNVIQQWESLLKI